MLRTVPASLVLLLAVVPSSFAKITTKVTLDQLVTEMPIIVTVKVTEFLPDKPAMVLTPLDKFRGELAFDRLPVNLTGDAEATKEKQVPLLLERLEKDMTLVLFVSGRGKKLAAVAFTEGTWFNLEGTIEEVDGKRVSRWRFTHAEPYFRRTFSGSTNEMIQAIQSGIKGGKLPEYKEKEEPGFGPPLKKVGDKKSALPPGRGPVSTSFGVIQLPFLGLIAALAALFPALFGGLAVFMRRWVAALSIAGFASMLLAIHTYFPSWLEWAGIKSPSRAWFACALIATIGGLWAARRYRRAVRDGKADEFQPRYADRLGLGVFLLVGIVGLFVARSFGQKITESPWLEMGVILIPVAFCWYAVLTHWLRSRGEPSRLVGVSGETIGLWTGAAASVVTGVAIMSMVSGPASEAGVGTTVQLDEKPLWVFQLKERGAIYSRPVVAEDRVFVTVHHQTNPVERFGAVYALNSSTGEVVWSFDNEGDMKPLFCSPALADGRLYFGEGYHTDKNSKLYCVDATTGKKVWSYETTSHTESTPAVGEGRVVFGGGDDGLYCLDAKTGEKRWQYSVDGGLHVDSNPVIHQGRVYAGSGTSRNAKNNRIFCIDLATGKEVWTEKIEYSAWGSPTIVGKHVLFPTGNGTYSEDRAPVAGLLLCRDAVSGAEVWQRALPNSLLGAPVADRYQVYVGCRDGNVFALDRHSGEVVWSKSLRSPVLASIALDVMPKVGIAEVVYAVGSDGRLEALSPRDGNTIWAVNVPSLVEMPYANTVATPVVVREPGEKVARRIFLGVAFGSSSTATPNGRLYCFRDRSE